MPIQNNTVSLSTGTEVYDDIKGLLTGYGWTEGPVGTLARSGNTLVFSATNWLNSLTHPYISVNGIAGYFPLSTSYAAGSQFIVTTVTSTDCVLITVRGPNPGTTGAYDVSYGSPQAGVAITTLTSVIPGDTYDKNVTIVSHPTTNLDSVSPTVYQKQNIVGTASAPAELLTVRPAVQAASSIGALPPINKSGTGLFSSKYFVVDNTYGLRGMLDHIYFARDANVAFAGDSGTPKIDPGLSFVHNGKPHYSLVFSGAYLAGGSVHASPLGVAHTAPTAVNTNGGVSGPVILVKTNDV